MDTGTWIYGVNFWDEERRYFLPANSSAQYLHSEYPDADLYNEGCIPGKGTSQRENVTAHNDIALGILRFREANETISQKIGRKTIDLSLSYFSPVVSGITASVASYEASNSVGVSFVSGLVGTLGYGALKNKLVENRFVRSQASDPWSPTAQSAARMYSRLHRHKI